jgi:uncharacterized damage-inducible protein DinB
MIESLAQRLRYNAWANDTLFRAMRAKDAPAASFRAFQHILEAEMTWSNRILGLDRPNIPLWGPVSLSRCDDWLLTARRQLEQIVAGDAASGFERTFAYRNSTGREFQDSVGQVLEHLLIHSAQYRGEAAGLSNAAAAQMPDLDYIIWLRAGKPRPGN